MLKKLGIVLGDESRAAEIFQQLHPNFFELAYDSPSDYIKEYWRLYTVYQETQDGNNNLNGKIFEYILATLCIRENITPFFISARVAFVPNVIYDLMFYTVERGPICWSVKTSLRERYKQADLEAMALKNVHRRGLSYLITLEEREATGVKKKIESGDVIGLNDVIVATSSEFDVLIEKMKRYTFINPPTIKVIESSQVISADRIDFAKSQDLF